MMGTLGLALILLGLMAWRAPIGGAFARFLPLPSSSHIYHGLGTSVSLTQIIAIGLAFVITAVVTVFLRVTKLGTAMRALANDREITATLGVPVRRVEAAAWFGSGIFCGAGRAAPARPAHLARLLGADVPRHLLARRRADRPAAVAVGDALRRARRRVSRRRSLDAVLRDRVTQYRAAAPFVLAIIALLVLSRRRVVTISRTPSSRDTPRHRRGTARHDRRRRPGLVVGGVRRCGLLVVVCSSCQLVGADWITTFTSVAIYSVVGARLRPPLRPRRHDLARPGRAALDRLLGRHAPRVRDGDPVPAAAARRRRDRRA